MRDLDCFATLAVYANASVAVAAVARVPRKHLTAGEIEHVLAVLPTDIKVLIAG